MTVRRQAGELFYGLLFAVVVPLALAVWAHALDQRLALPPLHLPISGPASVAVGVGVAIAGALIMLAGMVNLVVTGGGMPMNAFPPPRFVRTGVFRWVSNPIYLGFGCIVGGAALATGSSAGLLVVTPVVVLAMIALVIGYERPDLLRRFGNDARVRPLLSIPAAGDAAPARSPNSIAFAADEPPTFANRIAVLLWVLLPWVLVYYGIQALGAPGDRVDLSLSFERSWPVMQWTEAVYASTYLFVPLAVFIAASRSGLRRFAIAGAVSTVIVGVCWLVIPAVVVHRPFTADGTLGDLLAFEQAQGNGAVSFPAFHVLWALLAADVWADRARVERRDQWRVIGYGWAIAITVSTYTTGMHYLLDDAAAVLVYAAVRNPVALWQRLRGAAEWMANSWREWRIGPVRVINHGA
ncbi:MAG: phosphatase PAP2 family protein, partial [Gemmatimonadales bacterium]